jgi:curved DNA-binding protein CbpA
MYPHRKRSYYEILGVPRNASSYEIQKAYRDLALKYHPKNNSDPVAEQRFTEINEAYTHLSDAARRRNYDDFRFGELVPFTSYNIFNDFFNTKPFLALEDERLFRPLLMKNPAQMMKDFDKDWMEIESLGNNAEFAETYKSSTVQERGPQGLTGKTTTEKSTLKDGKRKTIKTEEVLKPDGTKEVTETTTEGAESKTSKYMLGPGQERKAIGQ